MYTDCCTIVCVNACLFVLVQEPGLPTHLSTAAMMRKIKTEDLEVLRSMSRQVGVLLPQNKEK